MSMIVAQNTMTVGHINYFFEPWIAWSHKYHPEKNILDGVDGTLVNKNKCGFVNLQDLEWPKWNMSSISVTGICRALTKQERTILGMGGTMPQARVREWRNGKRRKKKEGSWAPALISPVFCLGTQCVPLSRAFPTMRDCTPQTMIPNISSFLDLFLFCHSNKKSTNMGFFIEVPTWYILLISVLIKILLLGKLDQGLERCLCV